MEACVKVRRDPLHAPYYNSLQGDNFLKQVTLFLTLQIKFLAVLFLLILL